MAPRRSGRAPGALWRWSPAAHVLHQCARPAPTAHERDRPALRAALGYRTGLFDHQGPLRPAPLVEQSAPQLPLPGRRSLHPAAAPEAAAPRPRPDPQGPLCHVSSASASPRVQPQEEGHLFPVFVSHQGSINDLLTTNAARVALAIIYSPIISKK